MPPARLKARMDSLLSFPVGLFHPLQHAGLSRRSPVSRLIGMWLVPGTSRRERLQATHDRVPGYAGGHGQVLVQGERAEYHWTLIGTNTEPRRHGTPGSDQWLRALADWNGWTHRLLAGPLRQLRIPTSTTGRRCAGATIETPRDTPLPRMPGGWSGTRKLSRKYFVSARSHPSPSASAFPCG